jgi:hypothetical protein
MPSPTTDFRVDDELHEALQKAQDEIVGLLAVTRQQAVKIGKLQRETGARAREHDQWDRCARLHRLWRTKTDHPRSRFTVPAFRLALPFLQEYEDEVLVRAICGLAHKAYKGNNWWQTLFNKEKPNNIERYANLAPPEWKETLEEHAAELARTRL